MEDKITKATDELIQKIYDHELSSSKVPPEVTIEFYESIAEQLTDRARDLREEFGLK